MRLLGTNVYVTISKLEPPIYTKYFFIFIPERFAIIERNAFFSGDSRKRDKGDKDRMNEIRFQTLA